MAFVDVSSTYAVTGSTPAVTVTVSSDYAVLGGGSVPGSQILVTSVYDVTSPSAPVQLMRRNGSTPYPVRLGRRSGNTIVWLSPEVTTPPSSSFAATFPETF